MIVDFKEKIKKTIPEALSFERLETLQVNLGNRCNQFCTHCHIEAGPHGNKVMSREVISKIIGFLGEEKDLVLDLTGGCPELNPHLRFFIEKARPLTERIMVRSNLTIFSESGMDWLPEWYRDNEVVLIASLPCYTQENVEKQRGDGVFGRSIEALKKLNALGYGTSFELDLVYNPGRDFLPAPQEKLESDYRKHLLEHYGVNFHHLFTITNAPLGRFRNYLESNGLLERYNKLLAENFNHHTARNIMCRTLISVGWRGDLYGCDFNQAAGLPITDGAGGILRIERIREAIERGREIEMGQHCYSCTAGAGSSCTGILACE